MMSDIANLWWFHWTHQFTQSFVYHTQYLSLKYAWFPPRLDQPHVPNIDLHAYETKLLLAREQIIKPPPTPLTFVSFSWWNDVNENVSLLRYRRINKSIPTVISALPTDCHHNVFQKTCVDHICTISNSHCTSRDHRRHHNVPPSTWDATSSTSSMSIFVRLGTIERLKLYLFGGWESCAIQRPIRLQEHQGWWFCLEDWRRCVGSPSVWAVDVLALQDGVCFVLLFALDGFSFEFGYCENGSEKTIQMNKLRSRKGSWKNWVCSTFIIDVTSLERPSFENLKQKS